MGPEEYPVHLPSFPPLLPDDQRDDDDKNLWGSTVNNIIVRSPMELASTLSVDDINTILLAIPSATENERSLILKYLSQFSAKVQTIPSMSELILGAELNQVKEIDFSDILGRDIVAPIPDLISQSVLKKSICITGAGGSIGSEIARQWVGGD